MSETFECDGVEVGTGLLMPDERASSLMSSAPTYPQDMMLDEGEIKKLLADDYWKQSRKHLSKWMIHQGSLGKCNASATQGAMDQIRDNLGMEHVVLSDCHLYANINGGQDRGSMLADGFSYVQKFGIAPKKFQFEGKFEELPTTFYSRRQLDSDLLEQADKEALRFRGFEWYKAPKDYNSFKIVIASALARRQPVVFAWHVGSNSMRLRNGYVQVGRGPGNHATVFHSAKYVGGEDIVHPDCRNSWGPSKSPEYGSSRGSWGDEGYAHFTMEQAFACNRHHDTYIVTSARPDPNEFSIEG
jgi:hypothetical protein